MNVNDGSLMSLEEAREFANSKEQSFSDLFDDVKTTNMTEKQKETKHVSLKDHRSKLGKQLTTVRKERKLNRNDKCSCGSGLKYKKCCMK